jgi:hypothetical protein
MYRASFVALAACGRIGFGEPGDAGDTGDGSIATHDVAHDTTSSSSITVVGIGSGPHHAPGAVENVPLPTTVVAGDYMLLAFYADLFTANVTAPAGWQMRLQFNDATHLYQASFFFKVAGPTEPGSYNFAVTNSDQVGWALAVYRGVSAALPIDVDDANETSPAIGATDITYMAPSLDPTRAGDELVLLVVDDAGNGGTWTAPTNMTSRTPLTEYRTAIFDRALADAGATEEEDASLSVGGSTNPSGGYWFVALSR